MANKSKQKGNRFEYVPKWLAIGTCDMVLFKEDRGEIFKITRLVNGEK